ncbi:LPXTG cell wall anchor domain-containing protein [Enterococcus sp. ZJ1668]|uniref:LPXTG cell wall anchor domain-containing protein n=1 Tax=Enterococcus sp. ZJ1668 TaxID=2709402 RepID=UPI0013EA6163|nr:LPXTG cell wall anchor domain-containing protein [Enterococcus sp. ZJ1668]
MKKVMIALLFVALFTWTDQSFAEESKYVSNGETAFFGKYEYPDDTSENTISEENETTVKQYPKTAEKESKSSLFLGATLILIVYYGYTSKNRKKETK